MADEQVDEVDEFEAEAPRDFRGQASYDANRRERKARAADTMKANAEAAQKAKRKAQANAPTVKGAAAFAKKAKQIEASIQKPAKGDK